MRAGMGVFDVQKMTGTSLPERAEKRNVEGTFDETRQ
jgi:hypothetical protein